MEEKKKLTTGEKVFIGIFLFIAAISVICISFVTILIGYCSILWIIKCIAQATAYSGKVIIISILTLLTTAIGVYSDYVIIKTCKKYLSNI